MLDKFRSSKYYKLCGFICCILSVISIILFFLLFFSDFFKGENILLVVPIGILSILLFFTDALIFVILTYKAYLSTYSEESSNNKIEFNIIADIGYLFTTVYMIYGFYKYWITLLPKLFE